MCSRSSQRIVLIAKEAGYAAPHPRYKGASQEQLQPLLWYDIQGAHRARKCEEEREKTYSPPKTKDLKTHHRSTMPKLPALTCVIIAWNRPGQTGGDGVSSAPAAAATTAEEGARVAAEEGGGDTQLVCLGRERTETTKSGLPCYSGTVFHVRVQQGLRTCLCLASGGRGRNVNVTRDKLGGCGQEGWIAVRVYINILDLTTCEMMKLLG